MGFRVGPKKRVLERGGAMGKCRRKSAFSKRRFWKNRALHGVGLEKCPPHARPFLKNVVQNTFWNFENRVFGRALGPPKKKSYPIPAPGRHGIFKNRVKKTRFFRFFFEGHFHRPPKFELHNTCSTSKNPEAGNGVLKPLQWGRWARVRISQNSVRAKYVSGGAKKILIPHCMPPKMPLFAI